VLTLVCPHSLGGLLPGCFRTLESRLCRADALLENLRSVLQSLDVVFESSNEGRKLMSLTLE
jgi:hypothetical protein